MDFFFIRKSGGGYFADAYTKTHRGLIQPTENLEIYFPETRSKWFSYQSMRFQAYLFYSLLSACFGVALIVKFYNSSYFFSPVANILGFTLAGLGMFCILELSFDFYGNCLKYRRSMHEA